MKFIQTGDGSPTLEIQNSEQIAEKMHHGKGAFSESVMIYLSALNKAQELNLDLRVLSLGLGLGYNEFLTLTSLYPTLPNRFYLLSFESETILRDELTSYLTESPQVRREFKEAYDWILLRTCEQFQLPIGITNLKHFFRSALDAGKWQIGHKLVPGESRQDEPFHLIYYDAFSRKMSPEFWDPESINWFLKTFAAPACVFTTYAATGDLRRTLTDHGFQVELREGFGGKRHSTLAVRL